MPCMGQRMAGKFTQKGREERIAAAHYDHMLVYVCMYVCSHVYIHAMKRIEKVHYDHVTMRVYVCSHVYIPAHCVYMKRSNLCVCVCVSVCVRLYQWMYGVCACVSECLHQWMFGECVCVCVMFYHVYTHTPHTHIQIHMYTSRAETREMEQQLRLCSVKQSGIKHIHAFTHKCMYVYTYTCIYIYIYIYIHHIITFIHTYAHLPAEQERETWSSKCASTVWSRVA
jgi:hypothetical protein